MHQHVAHPPLPEQSSGVIDSISDSLLNAFSRVRKPDERFLTMREHDLCPVCVSEGNGAA